jgi:hypothetical protein
VACRVSPSFEGCELSRAVDDASADTNKRRRGTSLLEGVVVPRTAVRIVLVLLVLLVACLGAALEARGENPPPTLELLEPASGATVIISPAENKWATYRFRVTYPAGYTGIWVVALESAYDMAFTQNRSMSTMLCATNVSVCDLSVTSRSSDPPGTRIYWRVSIPDLVVSSIQTFVTAGPADLDRDGVPDLKDNCPSTPNPKQTDFENDGKGDACQPDRSTPRVKAYAGSAHRRQRAQFVWLATDNRPVTINVTVRWGSRLVLKGWWPNMVLTVPGARPARWESENPIPAYYPVGIYKYCVSATDAAGNKGTSCAAYRIKA